jgi:hypothetical protein
VSSAGCSAMRKYQSDDGPGIVDILEFLNGAFAPREDRLSFMKTQIVFWLPLTAMPRISRSFLLQASTNLLLYMM